MRTVKEHDVRRKEILDTAEGLFLAKGYEKTTINDILKMIGIAKGTFYHYFKSKEEVLDAVIMRVIQQDIQLAKAIAEDQQLTPFDKIIQFFIAQSPVENKQKSDMLEQFPQAENALMKQRALEATLEYVCPILAEIIEEGRAMALFETAFPLEAIQFLVAGIQTVMDVGPASQQAAADRLQAFIEIIFRVLGMTATEDAQQEINQKLGLIFEN